MEYIHTFVEGLDSKLGRGIPFNSLLLISGPAGSMKSTLALHMGYHNIVTQEGNLLYLTLQERKESLLKQMKSMNITFTRLPENSKFVIKERKEIISNFPTTVEDFTRKVKSIEKEMGGIDIMIIDSLNALYFLLAIEKPDAKLFSLFERLRNMNSTILLISEIPMNSNRFGVMDDVESYIVDGIIHLNMERIGRTQGRYISIIKMRWVKHSTDYFPLIVDDRGFRIVSH